jgi:hypothetical protein
LPEGWVFGITDAMLARGQIELDQDAGTVTEPGRDFLKRFGVAISPAANAGRLFCRACLDWSERRPHLAGALGVALTCRCFELAWVRKSRARGCSRSPKRVARDLRRHSAFVRNCDSASRRRDWRLRPLIAVSPEISVSVTRLL